LRPTNFSGFGPASAMDEAFEMMGWWFIGQSMEEFLMFLLESQDAKNSSDIVRYFQNSSRQQKKERLDSKSCKGCKEEKHGFPRGDSSHCQSQVTLVPAGADTPDIHVFCCGMPININKLL